MRGSLRCLLIDTGVRLLTSQNRPVWYGRASSTNIIKWRKTMTEYTTHVDSWYFNSIDYSGDVDSYSVWLWGGRPYSFDVYGYTVDPTLTLYDMSGNPVAYDDDSGWNLDSQIDYRPA